MSDYVLAERRHRHNQKCSERKRLNYPKIGHFDTWLIDSLQILVEHNHSVLLYPDWTNSSDYKDTNKTLGTIALHSEELQNAIEQIEITKVQLTSDMNFLCNSMGTKLPFLPITNEDEMKLFNKIVPMIISGKGSKFD